MGQAKAEKCVVLRTPLNGRGPKHYRFLFQIDAADSLG